MRLRSDADGTWFGGPLRLTGGLVGFGLVIAAASPFSGVPPQGASGGPAPAQVEVRVVPTGELDLDPVGTVLQPTAFPAPGEPGGPSVAISVRNITGVPLKLSIRFLGIAPGLDTAAKVRASAAGAVVVNGPLVKAAEWSRPAGRLESGQQTTLRVRFKLLPGFPPDAWRGRLDVRQLEIKGVKLSGEPASETIESSTPEGQAPAASTPPGGPPATTPPATTPGRAPAPEPGAPAQEQGRIPEGESAPMQGAN